MIRLPIPSGGAKRETDWNELYWPGMLKVPSAMSADMMSYLTYLEYLCVFEVGACVSGGCSGCLLDMDIDGTMI